MALERWNNDPSRFCFSGANTFDDPDLPLIEIPLRHTAYNVEISTNELKSFLGKKSGKLRSAAGSGRERSKDWIPWTAELVATYRDSGFTGLKVNGVVHMIDKRLNSETISTTSAEPFVRAVFERLERGKDT